jgi:hypothetical protein
MLDGGIIRGELPAQGFAVAAINDNPLTWAPRPVLVAPGTPIRCAAPVGVHVCRLNGQWVSQRDWDYPLLDGDVVEWFEVPHSRNTLRSAFQIATAVAAIYYPPLWFGAGTWQAAAASLAISVGGNLAINALLPLQLQGQEGAGQGPSPTYSTNLAGNQARLFQPIPKVLGYHLIFPPFAAPPYTRFQDNDQYYYALFAVSVDDVSIIRAYIDDTDISAFADVLVSNYLPPGDFPGSVSPVIVSSAEVVGTELKTARYVGGFAVCSGDYEVNGIEIDIVAPQGLSNLSCTFRVELRTVDAFGIPLTAWSTYDVQTVTANTTTPQRWTFDYIGLTPARYEVRLVRTDVKVETPGTAHTIQWTALRGRLTAVATLNPNVAHFEVVMRASEQLSALTQRRFGLLVCGHARMWHPDSGWTVPGPTRNPAWWLADLWTSTTWGEGLPDDRVDLLSLYQYALEWEARQDRCDLVLEQPTDSWEAAQTIARTGRARVFRRGGVYTLARDEAADLPVAAFTPRNTAPGSMSMAETMRTESSPDSVIVEYFDNRSWTWQEITELVPGRTAVTNPIIVRIPGITGRTHARREARYEAAALAYRTRSVACTTEMEGLLPSYMQAVVWQPDWVDYGASGDVLGYNAGTLELTLSEPVPTGATQCYLLDLYGQPWGPTAITVSGPRTVILESAPPWTPETEGAARERTKFVIGAPSSPGSTGEIVRVSSVADGGKDGDVQLWRIEAIVDDGRVHTADLNLLPASGEEQDPIDDGSGVSGSGSGSDVAVIVHITNRSLVYNPQVGDTYAPGAVGRVRLLGDGRLEVQAGDFSPASGTSIISDQWVLSSPLPVSDLAGYEVRATLLYGPTPSEGTLGAWIDVSTNPQWRYGPVYNAGAPLLAGIRIEIRDPDGLVQGSATFTFEIGVQEFAGGA